jgi:hypothetical protein
MWPSFWQHCAVDWAGYALTTLSNPSAGNWTLATHCIALAGATLFVVGSRRQMRYQMDLYRQELGSLRKRRREVFKEWNEGPPSGGNVIALFFVLVFLWFAPINDEWRRSELLMASDPEAAKRIQERIKYAAMWRILMASALALMIASLIQVILDWD